MFSLFHDSLLTDLLDILLVAWLIYRLLLLVHGTRAIQMFAGLGILVLLSWLADRMGMMVTRQIISSLQTVWVVAFLIIFQPELRTALTYLGRRRWLHVFGSADELSSQSEIIKATERLSRRGLGALIVLEREISLGRWIKTGTELDARISSELIEAIFTVPGPLHDGAIIISQDRIAAAACILPNSEQPELSYQLGTRHRAAIGLTEVSDAVVIVVSEETRAISLAYQGKIERGLSGDDLTALLNKILSRPTEKQAAAATS